MSQAPLLLTVTCARGHVVDAGIVNDRPMVMRLLIGRLAEDIPTIVSGLFAICRQAQGAAARLAVDVARGSPAILTTGERQSIVVEAIKEHLRRILVDWPGFLRLPPDVETYVELFKALDRGDLEAVRSWLGTARFHPLFDALADVDQTDTGSLPGDFPTVPTTSARDWLDRLGGVPDDVFCRFPTWDGTPAETGGLARQGNNPEVRAFQEKKAPLSARLAALCADVRAWGNGAGPADFADACCGGSNIGLARVETARGILIHGVQLDQAGRVSAYGIVAPTEWNFHPNGAFKTQAMRFSGSPKDLDRPLRALALALNPCVSFDLSLRETGDA